MKPVRQTKFVAEHGRGNCMSAALASLLGMELDEIPQFENMGDEWREEFWKWLDDIPYDFCGWSVYDERPPSGYCVGIGTSPRGDFRHAVILKDGELVFDPHPSDSGLRKLESVWVFTRKEHMDKTITNYIDVEIKSDGDGHDFIIPVELADEFSDLLEESEANDDYDKFNDRFGKYATGGAVSQYQLAISESELKRLTNG